MALNIKDPTTDRLVRELAAATGESITQAVERAVVERLDRVRGRSESRGLAEELAEIAERCAGLPLLDERSDEEILGYDAHGVPI